MLFEPGSNRSGIQSWRIHPSQPNILHQRRAFRRLKGPLCFTEAAVESDFNGRRLLYGKTDYRSGCEQIISQIRNKWHAEAIADSLIQNCATRSWRANNENRFSPIVAVALIGQDTLQKRLLNRGEGSHAARLAFGLQRRSLPT